MVVILYPLTLEGTEGAAVLLVPLVDFLVELQLVRCGAAEGTLAALDGVLQVLLRTDLALVLTPVLGQQLVLSVDDDLLRAVLGVLRIRVRRLLSVA